MPKIGRLLIANRGEIACRIARTARRLGIETVAVYSEADAAALHVAYTDQAVCIGPPPVSESYLDIAAIVDAAKRTGSDAVHPGYGFLSENAAFARACREAGLIFVGPLDRAIDIMGDKARAKRAMLAAGVPCAPGYQGEDQSDAVLAAEAAHIGFPLMVKAAAGGGGRGMRLVRGAEELASAVSLARSEAEAAFGSGDLILEKAILRPRHVEIQVFGDEQGNIIHLGERDCSVQRRHQKVVEESPCPVMTDALREAMGRAAVEAARAVDYVGAGTVEFLLDEDASFYFLEMNTRLQVEHPVTEEVTGLDLVALQLKVAAGEPLGLVQSDVRLEGHAIEVRLYAEDPQNDFLPATGKVRHWRKPAGPGVRLDAGVDAGGEMSPFYDPMAAKVIARGADREEARRRLVTALQRSALVGPANNRDFLIDVLSRPSFVEDRATTAFIAEEYGEEGFCITPSGDDFAMAAVVHYRIRQQAAMKRSLSPNPELANWASNGLLSSVFEYGGEDGAEDGGGRALVVTAVGADVYDVTGDGETKRIAVEHFGEDDAVLSIGGVRRRLTYFEGPDGALTLAGERAQFTVRDGADRDAGKSDGGDGVVSSPMHGLLQALFVREGDAVEAGQRLAVVEAMKMMHEVSAPVSGSVRSINVSAPSQVAANDVILEIEPSA